MTATTPSPNPAYRHADASRRGPLTHVVGSRFVVGEGGNIHLPELNGSFNVPGTMHNYPADLAAYEQVQAAADAERQALTGLREAKPFLMEAKLQFMPRISAANAWGLQGLAGQENPQPDPLSREDLEGFMRRIAADLPAAITERLNDEAARNALIIAQMHEQHKTAVEITRAEKKLEEDLARRRDFAQHGQAELFDKECTKLRRILDVAEQGKLAGAGLAACLSAMRIKPRTSSLMNRSYYGRRG